MATIVQPIAMEAKPDLLTIAQKSIESSRRAVEKLIDSIPREDHFTLGVLGPILAGLRDMDGIMKKIV